MSAALPTLGLLKSAVRLVPYRPNCLQQSLVLAWMLRHQGMASDLRIGFFIGVPSRCLKSSMQLCGP